MVLEQVLTIIFAAGVGAAVIGYAVKPRNRGASISVGSSAGPSGMGSFAPAQIVQAAPMPQITAVETPVVETYSPEVTALPSVSEVVPVVAEVAAAGPAEVASVATEMVSPSSAAPVSIAETVEAPATVATSPPKAQRKRSTSTKPRAKSTRKAKTAATAS